MFSKIRNFFKSAFTSGFLNLSTAGSSSPIDERKGNRTFNHRLTRQYQYRVKMELDTWRNAVESAENILLPRRDDLYKLYRQAMEDDTLLSETRKAHIMVQRSPFVVKRKDKDNTDMTELFNKPWFRLFLRHWLDAEFWGHSLIELLWKEGEVNSIELIPREHVRPETGEVLLSVHDTKGIAFDKLQQEFGVKILPIGEPFDLGLLKTASRTVITKNYSDSDWSQYNEKYGMPIAVAGTKEMNDTEADNMAIALSNLGSNGYFMPFDVEQVKLLERQGTTGYKTYEDLIQRKENNIAKLINGQTGTSDEKAFVGAAQVHERVLNDYTFSRLTNCQDYINFTLIPFLADNGYPLKKWDKLIFTELLQKAPEQQVGKTPDTPQPPDPQRGSAEKKKPNPNIGKLYFGREDGCCDHNVSDTLKVSDTLAFDFDKLFDKAIEWVFKKKEKAEGKVHAATWRKNVEELTKGIDTAFGTEYKDDTEKDLHTQLKTNAAVFAAFKNHAQNVALVAALTDDAGNLRSFNDFKKQAAGILTDFNVNYLKTEYQTAVASAQMAVQWHDFQRTKEDFPYLRYVTVGDDRVRKSHQLLDGVTLPIDDEFWTEWFPPNNWNCFTPDTLILTTEGWKAINSIVVGNKVIGGSGVPQTVEFVHANDFDGRIMRLVGEEKDVKCTPNHRILTLKGWIRADNLKAGDIVVQLPQIANVHKAIGYIDHVNTVVRNFRMAFPSRMFTIDTLNTHIQFGQVNIHPILGNALVKNNFVTQTFKMVNHPLFVLRRFLFGIGMSVQTVAIIVNTLFSGFFDNIVPMKSTFNFHRFRDFRHRVSMVCSSFLADMRTIGCHSSVNIGKHLPCFGFAVSVTNPLQFNRFASSTGFDATVSKNFDELLGLDFPTFFQHSESAQFINVQTGEGFTNGAPLNPFNSLKHFIRYALFHLKCVKIESIKTESYKGKVFNLTVANDESYITQLGVVHNCRCDVQQVGSNSKTKEAKAVPTDAPAMFKNNSGLSGQIFTEEHPYYEGLTDTEKENIVKQIPKI